MQAMQSSASKRVDSRLLSDAMAYTTFALLLEHRLKGARDAKSGFITACGLVFWLRMLFAIGY